ncbi:hypothetical protein DC522_32600 [Microvirga sp. KLBC 81]|uniref:tyrosine-type recombinase/integrase n=1 Tax=Microvirga sp. KLBC 81 TaxID=1862707 RepID=UPI000D51E23F|nr:integrase family protein [Microvirga sp. KLBC 81]PVE20393.1 hypothetical protein DC522_32600 [Microvirga sp. KLBC 81]
MPIIDLTTAYVRSIKPPPTGRLEIWDKRTPGLCLRVTPTGAASWSFRYRPRNGSGYERITLGSLQDLTLAGARERAVKFRGQVVDGSNPQKDRRERREAAKQVLSFDRLAERYLEEYAKPNKASWKMDEMYLKRPRAALGEREAKAITRRDVIDVLDTIKKTAPVSANRTQTVLVKLFNWAVDSEFVPANPIAGLKKRVKEEAKSRVLDDEEIRVLYEALTKADGVTRDVADALLFLLLTGQRPSDAAGMVVTELFQLNDPAKARLEISARRHKSRRLHVVPLTGMARHIIASALERRARDGDEHGSVFASKFSNRATLARNSLSQGLARVIERLKDDEQTALPVQNLKNNPPTPHDFRRTVGTGLARLGVLREDRKAVLGHAESDVHGMVYDQYERLREKRIALEAWDRHVSELVTNKKSTAAVLTLKRRSS